MKCVYKFGETEYSLDEIYDKLKEHYVNSHTPIVSILYSNDSKAETVISQLEDLKNSYKGSEKLATSANVGEDVSYSKDSTISITDFLDSPIATIDDIPIYQQQDNEDFKKSKLKSLIEFEHKSEEEAKIIVDNLFKNWEIISTDGKAIHRLCSGTYFFNQSEFEKHASSISSSINSPILQNTALLSDFRQHLEAKIKSISNTDGQLKTNINLTTKLQRLDVELFAHLDYVFVDSSGNIHIYNIKATSENPSYWDSAKKQKYDLEGAFIKQMLRSKGFTGQISYSIIPIRINYSKKDYSSLENVKKIDVEPVMNNEYFKGSYTQTKLDRIAAKFIEAPTINPINESEFEHKTNTVLNLAFPEMEIFATRISKTAKEWIQKAPSVGDTTSPLLIKEVNATDHRYEVFINGEKTIIHNQTNKNHNPEILELVKKHLTYINNNLGNYATKLTQAIVSAMVNKDPIIDESIYNSTFVNRVLSKYLPQEGEDSDWELLEDLVPYNILLFQHKDTKQVDMIILSKEDLYQLGKFRRNGTNILASYRLDGHSEASTLRGDFGNIELMKGMLILNTLLEEKALNNPKLGEISVISSINNGQSRHVYAQDFENEYFKHFYKIIKQENQNSNDTIKSLHYNFKSNLFIEPIEGIILEFKIISEKAASLGWEQSFLENIGYNENLKEEANYAQALFKILTTLHEGSLLKGKSENQIADLAHPKQGVIINQKVVLAAQLYEHVSRAYLHYSQQNIEYNKELTPLEKQSFTAPTIPDSNIRLVVNNLQTTLDAIAFQEMEYYEKNLRKLMQEFHQKSGYGQIQNLTLGNQLHLYDNLYQTDESGNKMLIFKNPYDTNNDLKDYERVFLKKVLFLINELRFGEKNKFKNENDPDIIEYLNGPSGEKYLWVPLMRASKASQRQQGLSARAERLKRASKLVLRSDEWYMEYVSKMTKEERETIDEGIEALSLKNPFIIGDSDYNVRQNYIEKYTPKFFETNVEEILVEYMSKSIETEKLNDFLVGTKALLLQLHLMGDDSEEAKKIVEKEAEVIRDYLKQNVFNKPTMHKSFQKAIGALSGVKRAVTLMNLGGNAIAFFRDIENGFMENFLRSVTHFQTDIKASYLTKAYEYVIKNGRTNAMNINLLGKLNIRYRLSNTDLARIKERLKTNTDGVVNWDNWAYATLRSPDFLNRMTLFVARCMQDGVWDAYSLENGKLTYDVKKDSRFTHFIHDHYDHPDYAQQKALFQLHVKNWNKEHRDNIDWHSKILTEPYSDQEILAIKNVANNIYGSYDKSLKSQYEFTALGWAFTMYTTWMNGIWNNWFMKPGKYNIHKMLQRQETDAEGRKLFIDDNGLIVTEYINDDGSKVYKDENGEEYDLKKLTPILEEVPVIVQGIIYTLKDAFSIFRETKSIKSVYNYIQSNETDAKNMSQALKSLIIAMIWAILFKYALTPAYNESKKKTNDLNVAQRLAMSITYRSLNGARDSFSGPLNVFEYFGEQMEPPIYRVPMKLIQDGGKVIFGDKSLGKFIASNFAIIRAANDIIPK